MKLTFIWFILFCATLSAKGQSTSDMLEKTIGGVVTVAVYKTEIVNRTLGFRGGASFPEVAYEKALDLGGSLSSGSGFLYEYKGKKYIITNAHVIENASESDSSIFAFSIDRSKYELKVLGGDNFYDIAVLEFVTIPGAELKVLQFKKTEPRLGESVYAIGNPLGEYPYSVSDGIISAKNRVMKNSFKGRFGFLQTTATIIWGNSGGPLVDATGKVVGINSQIAFAPSGQIQPQINFALEASLSERLIKEIVDNKGRVIRSYFGLEASQSAVVQDGILYPINDKIYVSGVVPGSPAFAVLSSKVGYQLVSVNNEKILSVEHLLGILEQVKPTQSISVAIKKDSISELIKITASELKTKELEEIAVYVLHKSIPIQYDPTSVNVQFTYDPRTVFEIGDQKQPIQGTQAGGKTTFQVLSAGVVGSVDSDMYKILELRDLGAVIRLAALQGVLDFSVVKKGDEMGVVKIYRYYLSGDDNEIKSTLYY